MRAGDPTGGHLVTQPPVEHAVSSLHSKANDSDSALPRAAEFLLLLASLQAVQGSPAAFSEAERQESSPLFKPQFMMSWAV